MEAIDQGYSYSQVSAEYDIPKSSLRDHVIGKTRSRKMGPKGVLTDEEEFALCEFIQEMREIGHSLTSTQVKIKVEQMIQQKITSFKEGIPRPSWWKWFKHRHQELILRTPQGLDRNRTRTLNSNSTSRFYTNLEEMYTKYNYGPDEIWNRYESGVQANKNGLGKVRARKDAGKVK